MSVDPRVLLGKSNLTPFERQYLLDRNMLDHPGLGQDAESTFLDTGYQGNVPDDQGDAGNGPEPVETWDSLTVAELQAEAKARELSTTGKKEELIARIEKFDDENTPTK